MPLTINKNDRQNLNFFKQEKRDEFISNISARTNMDASKLRTMSFKQLKELSEGLIPQVDHVEAVKSMTPPTTAEVILNKRTINNDHREALIENLLEKRPGQFTREELENMGTIALEEAAAAVDAVDTSPAVSAMTANRSTKQAILRKRKDRQP